MNKWEIYLHKEGIRMTTRINMKIMDKRSKVLCPVVIMMVMTGIVLLAPRAQVAVAQDEVGARPERTA